MTDSPWRMWTLGRIRADPGLTEGQRNELNAVRIQCQQDGQGPYMGFSGKIIDPIATYRWSMLERAAGRGPFGPIAP